MDVAAGDEVSFVVLITSRTTGTFTITKASNFQSQVIQVSAPHAPLCLSSAGWFVDGPTSVTIANFSEVVFDAPFAILNGRLFSTESSGAFVADIERNVTFTETTVTALDVTVKYVH